MPLINGIKVSFRIIIMLMALSQGGPWDFRAEIVILLS
jgi:hypothetical protein